MTQMDELIAFLTRCLDEDERVARQMTAEPGGFYLEAETESVNIMTVGAFVHRWNPKRVLAEAEAKRRILDEHTHYDVPGGFGCGICSVDPHMNAETAAGWCTTVRLLAQPYAGQDGWREEWQLSAPS
jgi:hypothetical protein